MSNLKAFLQAHKFQMKLKEAVEPDLCVTELVCCRNGAGKSFYAYIRIKPSEYMDYRLKLERGIPVNPNEYEILEYGWGDSPPDHVRERMEAEFGADHGFEVKMHQAGAGALHAGAV